MDARAYGRFGKTTLVLALALGSVVMLLPLFWTVSSSLQSTREILTYPPTFWPHQPLWRNYASVFRLQPFARFYLNTGLLTVCEVIGVLISSSLAAYAFARIRFFARDAIFVGYLATLMIPYHVRIIPLFLTMKSFDWVDTYWGLIIPGLASPFGTFLLRQFFLSIPMDLEDAARIDGSSRVGIYLRVILPLAVPAMSALGIFVFMGSWNSFLWPLIITNSPEMKTLSVGITNFIGEFAGETAWNLIMAASVMIITPVVIAFLVAQKGFIKGIALTGMKG
jgi:multiple sugar transport system permease protein